MTRYKAGDKIGPYQITLVERFSQDKNKKYKGKFICPFCSTPTKKNYFIAIIDNVRTGNTRSCGCEHTKQRQRMGLANKKDLTGEKFGKLTVLGDSYQRDKNRHVLWECQCSCKNYTIVLVTTSNLKDGSTSSCGCGHSSGEIKIKSMLDKLQISYKKEKSFPDCVNPNTGYPLRFDFYLPDYNCCIEYDGIQHFEVAGWNTEENYYNLQKRDTVKNNYCKDKGIKLVRIPYTDFKLIDEDYIQEIIKQEGVVEIG